MVDIIKFLPHILPSFPSNIHRIRNRSSCEQFFFSTIKQIPENDYSNIINNTKRWIARCPGDPPRPFNISNLPYNLHRKVTYPELSRYYSATTTTTTVDTSASIKIKQQPQQQKNSNKEPLKATTVTSNSVLSNVDVSNTDLFDALSQHVTIKAEPLRPANNFVNNTSNTSSSWQKYWTSTNPQRRRKEVSDTDSIFYRPKREQSLSTTIHFVTTRDSSFHTNTENTINSRTPSSCTPTKFPSPILSTKEEESQFFSPSDQISPMNLFKTIEEKSLSPRQIKSPIIHADNEINRITTKFYKLPLPSNKPKLNKSSSSKKGSRSKFLEKKPLISPTLLEKKQTTTTTTSAPKRRQQTASNKSHRPKTTIKKQQSLSKTMTKWDEPYIGVRYDPPTPPCSPSLSIFLQDENDKPSE